MKLAMQLQYSGGFKESAQQVSEYEKAGLDIVWVAEAYGFDAPSFMGYLAATTETIEIGAGILPIYTRTPTLLAMTAAGVDAMTDGRCILGLGASGPQVIEGFHGVVYDAPVGRTREIIDICRMTWKRERVTYQGKYYNLPLPEGEGTGLGKPLKTIAHPVREHIPIYVASLGPANVRMTAEKADGWLPIFYLPERADEVWGDDLRAGAAKRDPSLGPLQVVGGGIVAVTDDPDPILDLGRGIAALYIGGMGARERNFYNQLACRYGYEAEAKLVQDLYLDGKKKEAAEAIPREFLELTNLVGPEGWIKDRLAAYAEAGVSILNVIPVAEQPTALLESVRGWVDDLQV
jgi:F420-dependent oxidoreductase-like protein